ncbi:M23 family metallopeptidase [Sedimentimonas flavescens]|uniref:M23 family metallopeptidase n=1 Tax=Sedimentimonas flavescens TaxID=2851012 RepID=UPI0021A7BCA5|nr:M23 family metallopeptidase [Sedimentimonas flavescens]MCT2540734.1 M23 family metallopeptidase [Sedimentimonas flavescens]
MPRRLLDRANSSLERWLPEQRLFMKSDSSTRFVRLRPLTQTAALGAVGMLFVWSVLATSLLFIDRISSGSAREQAAISQAAFEMRLDSLARERDARAREASAAQQRFQTALEQVSQMQTALLSSEERRRELETGINVIQSTLRRTMNERDTARLELADAHGADVQKGLSPEARVHDLDRTMDMLTAVLGRTAAQRDAAARDAEAARLEAEDIALEKRLMEERNDEIFTTLEGAVQISMEPLNKMFKAAGMNPDSILSQVRRGYSGTGGPLLPIAYSSKGALDLSADTDRANEILTRLDEMNMYRIAVDRLPFALPVKQGSFRFTSPYGYRWGRLHAGIDLAGRVGTDIHAPADGTVTDAGWENGYGNVIKIRHEFGITTVYAHLSKIRVKAGQKVSRGELIGDMGNTGRSTGPHLHYEIRVDGSPTNPMTFIKAAKDVF